MYSQVAEMTRGHLTVPLSKQIATGPGTPRNNKDEGRNDKKEAERTNATESTKRSRKAN